MRLNLNRRCAMNSQCANAFQAVMQARRLARVKAHSPAITYVADRKMGHTDVKDGQQMIQDHVRG